MNVVLGFLMYTMIGFLLLLLPFFHKEEVSLIDHLFIATSAVSTTGLVTLSIYDAYNLGGQLIILALIQVGGIGYMTLTTYYLLYTTQRITHWHNRVIGAEFSLPKTIRINDFIRSVILFTLVMEILGAVSFYIGFAGSGMETGKAIWFSVFHSVSAFCTAGFGLFENSFVDYGGDVHINATISVLAIAGSLGFIVITDLWYRITKRTRSLSFTTKIIFYAFLILLIGGTGIVYLLEPAIDGVEASLMKSFFQTMTAMTTVGFNTIDTSNLSLAVLLFVIFLMYLGASPSGTAGGLKITTLTAMVSVLKSRLYGQKKITFMKRAIPFERLYVATSTFMLYTSIIFIFTFLLSFIEGFSLKDILFEVSSALGTVGLSTGITGNLSALGKLLIIILMFVGRVGVLTFGFALLERKNHGEELDTTADDLAV